MWGGALLAEAFRDSECPGTWAVLLLSGSQFGCLGTEDWASTPTSLAAGPSPSKHLLACSTLPGTVEATGEMRFLWLGTIVGERADMCMAIRSLRWGVPRSQWTASLSTTQCSYVHSQQLEWDQQGLSKRLSIMRE